MPKDLDSDHGEIPLVDDLESNESNDLDDSEIPLEPVKSEAPGSVQPLRRLWKSDEDEDANKTEETETENAKKNKTAKADEAPARASYSVPVARARKSASKEKKSAKSKAAADHGGETKKPLIEETPALDTYEARQRARMIVGGLLMLIMVVVAWSGYRTFIQSSGSDDLPTGDPSGLAQVAPEPKVPLDLEASFMLARAAERAKQGHTDQAIAMLKNIVKVYPKTAAGYEAQAALDRPKRNLPLFLDRPAVVAVSKSAPATAPNISAVGAKTATPANAVVAAAPPSPTPTVNAVIAGDKPGQGQATVIPPRQPSQAQNAALPNQAMQTPASQNQAPRTQTPQDQPPTAVMLTPPPSEPTAVAKAEIVPTIPRTLASRTLPNGFRAITEAGIHESGWPLMITSDRDQAPMVLVPGAVFTMGNDRGDPAESPAHSVRLSTYYIDQHEVTCAQFRFYLEKLEKEPHGKATSAKWLTDEKFRATPDTVPVVMINYREADSFALWAGKRLPTEAQWEMAARSFESRRYPWGDDPARWTRPRQPRQVGEIKAFPEDESIYGAFDLAGNALEWTRDWFDPHYYDKFAKKVAEDPSGPIKAYKSILRVVKGGSKNWILSAREGIELDRRLPYLGFRCTLAVEGPDAPASIVVRTPTKPASPQVGQPAPEAGAPPPF